VTVVLSRKLVILFLVSFFILANNPSVLCVTSAPIIYVSGDGSGDFNCNATNADMKINEALQLVADDSSYTTVYLKGPFTYTINDTLLIGNSTTLEGDSSAIIKLVNNCSWAASKPMIQERSFGNHDIFIRGFTIDGNREGNTQVSSGKGYHNLIHLTGCQNISVCDMYLTNNHGDGLKTSSCSNIKLYNNTIYELGHDALYSISCSNVEACKNKITCRTNSGLRLYNSNNASFYENIITSNDTGGAGIEIQKYGTPEMNNIEVYNNTIYKTALAGIWIFGSNSYNTSSAYVHIHHNQIYNTGTRSNNNVIGGILSDGFNALIENNVIESSYGAGIVQNNVYSPGPAGSGYVITVRNNIITNIQESAGGGNGYGIYNLLAGTHSFILQNNCFYNNTGGDYQGAQASPSDIGTDPDYADQKIRDYHLKSKYGRWNGNSWTTDSISSPCIDAGYSFSDYSNEPEDNGDRVNIGAYGNTVYASKSGTSIPDNGQPIPFKEVQISTDRSDQSCPAIDGGRIAWADNRNGNSDIYICDLSTFTETQITKNGFLASNPSVQGNRIVWADNRNGNLDIYMYDLSTSTETQITANETWQEYPAIYGDRIVWVDWRNGNSDIYLYNLTTATETPITMDKSDQGRPTICGDRIVWQDARNGNWDIYMYNIQTSSETQITTNGSDQCRPVIYGDKITWQDNRNGNSDIYMYNLTTFTETQITKKESDQFDPAIYGDLIVWQDNSNGNSDIYMYNLTTSTETQITKNQSRQGSPAIYGGRIVWNDGRNGNSDIYMCTVYGEEAKPTLPVANFTSNVTSGYAPLNVLFTDMSKGKPAPTSWNWNFGDLTSSTQKNPVHIYSKAGSYTVTLTVSNVAGSNTIKKTSYITASTLRAPVAAFSANVTSGTVPLSVLFTDKSTGGSISSWAWSFGDGTSSVEQNPVHVYSKTGKYTVKLTAKNAAGNNAVTKSNYITVNALKPPVAAFSASPTSGKAQLNVTFTDKSTGSPTSWSWVFGDGSTSTLPNPVHTYSKAGKYTVRLTARNAAGSNTATRTNYISVGSSLGTAVGAFSASPTSGKAPLRVQFTDKSTGSPTSWRWVFGDGTSSTSKNPVHIYTKKGRYTVSLTIKNTQGSNTNSRSDYITVS
jgi:beta propeller repeat protein